MDYSCTRVIKFLVLAPRKSFIICCWGIPKRDAVTKSWKSCAKTSGYISFVVKSKESPQVFLTYPPKRLYIKSNWLTPSQIVFGLPCTIWLVEFRVSIATNKCPPTRPNVSKINLHPPRKWPFLGPPCLISSKASRVKMPFSGSLASKRVDLGHQQLGRCKCVARSSILNNPKMVPNMCVNPLLNHGKSLLNHGEGEY